MEQIFRDKFSGLKKTWIFDLDGTLVKHNGYLIDGDVLLDGVKDFFDKNIDIEDYVLILTARKDLYREETEKFLLKNNIRYDKIPILIILPLPPLRKSFCVAIHW